jgi:3-isopropylmalate/(R)-2-methylmalate dehydratase small subunit
MNASTKPDPVKGYDWRLRGRAWVLGHDIPHQGGVVPGWIVTGRHMAAAEIVPHLFEETDPGFHTRCRPGDIIVAGRSFGMGPKMNGYIAMQALGLGLVCESMPFLGYRGAIGAGLRVLTDCQGATEECETGDELEVDFDSGMFINHTRGTRREYPPLADSLKEIVALGGNTGWLQQWWAGQQGDGAGRNPAGDRGGRD